MLPSYSYSLGLALDCPLFYGCLVSVKTMKITDHILMIPQMVLVVTVIRSNIKYRFDGYNGNLFALGFGHMFPSKAEWGQFSCSNERSGT